MNMTPMIDCVFNLLIFFMLISDLNQKDLVELTLPVAYMAEEDRGQEEDDRVILNIDKYGIIHWKGNQKTLDELGTILSNARDKYELKMRQQGKSGLEDLPGGGKASKLYVLLRADKDTPWQHVQWLMTIMAEQKLYKLQFATKKFKDSNYSEEEATALDARTQKEVMAPKGGQ
ncbi:MAG TPA: biopolymer transporter ExbD [Planctomycetota bacterium]|nr:biopolymer transporter ExbD [Planctomycetota bacterium]